MGLPFEAGHGRGDREEGFGVQSPAEARHKLPSGETNESHEVRKADEAREAHEGKQGRPREVQQGEGFQGCVHENRRWAEGAGPCAQQDWQDSEQEAPRDGYEGLSKYQAMARGLHTSPSQTWFNGLRVGPARLSFVQGSEGVVSTMTSPFDAETRSGSSNHVQPGCVRHRIIWLCVMPLPSPFSSRAFLHACKTCVVCSGRAW